VKRLEGKPFTLVSISVDENRETVTEFLKKEPMPWTHWFNGPKGNVITELNVWGYPRIYVLDANGVIRYKGGALDMRGKVLDQTLDALLKEVEQESQSQVKFGGKPSLAESTEPCEFNACRPVAYHSSRLLWDSLAQSHGSLRRSSWKCPCSGLPGARLP
jgi:hypothetical protein